MKLKFSVFLFLVLALFLASCTSLTSLFAGLWQVGGVVLLSEGNQSPSASVMLNVNEISKGLYKGSITVGEREYVLDNLTFSNDDISFEFNGVVYTGKISDGDIEGVTPAEWTGKRIK